MFFTYVLENPEGTHYIGHTNDLGRRLREHNEGESDYTAKTRGLWKLVYKKEFQSRGEAMKHEKLLNRQKGGKGFYTIISGVEEKDS
jgi:predicted GIY-YIG superfamily endonuclease